MINSIQAFQEPKTFKAMNDEFVPKIDFYVVSPDGEKILNELIKNDVLESVSETEVKLKDRSVGIKDKIRAIAGDNFEKIIKILGLSDGGDKLGNVALI